MEISPEYSLEGLMLKLKLQYFGHLMRSVDSSEKTLMLGGIGGRRRRGLQRMKWLDDITDLMDMIFSKPLSGDGQGCLACFSPWVTMSQTHWVTELSWTDCYIQRHAVMVASHRSCCTETRTLLVANWHTVQAWNIVTDNADVSTNLRRLGDGWKWVTQSCLTLCISSVPGILQERILR